MANLISKSPLDGILPLSGGGLTATELAPTAITSCALQKGANPAAFKTALGMAFPSPDRATGKEGNRAVWMGPELCFVLGPRPDKITGIAMTDQSDGWVSMRVEGAEVPDLLARLTSVDLRDSVFKRGHSARTVLGHVSASITRTGADTYDLLVPRSMAQTVVHELERAMKAIDGRRALAER